MIDLHSHILPSLDDGANDLSDSLAMARMAVKNGTRIIAGTPHSYYLDRYYYGKEPEIVLEAFKTLKNALEEENIPLTLVTGMEIFGDRDTAEKLTRKRFLTLNNTASPLIEFDFDVDEKFIWDVMLDVKSAGYKPILAHPERYKCFYYNTSFAYDLYKENVALQVNKGSIMGHFGRRVEQTAHRILRHRLAALVASDAHNIYSRTTDMLELADMLDEMYGDGCSDLLLNVNPQRILDGKEVIWAEPIEF